MSRLLVLVVVVVALVSACLRDPKPTAEFARAKKAYDDAMAETADTSYTGARWDEVIRDLRAVPESNPREHHTAQILADDIESTRAKLAAEIKHSNDQAKKLLVVDTGPPLPTPQPHTNAPASSSSTATPAAKKNDAPAPAPPQSSLDVPGNACGRACQDQVEACLAAAGCKQDGSRWSCADGSKMGKCTNDLAQCSKDCSSN